MTDHLVTRVLASRAAGSLRVVTLAPVARRTDWLGEARPGQFVMVNIGAHRRAFWIHRVAPAGGYAATVDLVVNPLGPAAGRLAGAPVGAPFEVTGPLGRGFRLPKGEARATLVGSEHSAAPLLGLAERLRQRHCQVRLVLLARDDGHRFGALEGRRAAHEVLLPTGDDVAAVDLGGPDLVYAVGRPALLEAVAARADGAVLQCAVETPLACGTGLCQGCPVIVSGSPAPLRVCTEGPVLPGDRVDWRSLS